MTEGELLRTKIEDLVASASASNHPWDAWALEFIESMESKLNILGDVQVSPKQKEKILDLWEKL
jgi:hypothetical protein